MAMQNLSTTSFALYSLAADRSDRKNDPILPEMDTRAAVFGPFAPKRKRAG